VLLLAVTGGYTEGTRIAAAVFVMARLAYLWAYLAGQVWPRSISWTAGLLATLYLLGSVLYGLVYF